MNSDPSDKHDSDVPEIRTDLALNPDMFFFSLKIFWFEISLKKKSPGIQFSNQNFFIIFSRGTLEEAAIFIGNHTPSHDSTFIVHETKTKDKEMTTTKKKQIKGRATTNTFFAS